MTFFLVQVWLWEVFWELLLGPTIELVVTGCCVQPTFSPVSQSNWEMVHCCCIEWDILFKIFYFQTRFLISSQFMRHLLTDLFHPSNLLQMPNNCTMVNAAFLGNFLCSCKISFYDPLNWLLSTSNGQPLCSSSSRRSTPCLLLHSSGKRYNLLSDVSLSWKVEAISYSSGTLHCTKQRVWLIMLIIH